MKTVLLLTLIFVSSVIARAQNIDTSKPIGVSFNNWFIDVDNLKLVKEKESLNIVWDADADAKEGEYEYYRDPVLFTDKNGKVLWLKVDDKIVGDAIVNYTIQLQDTLTKVVKWEYSPDIALALGRSLKCIVDGDHLFIAVYSPIASGSDLVCVSLSSGKEIWRGEIKQLMVDHSQYMNNVFIQKFGHKVVFIGNEIGGKYLQIIDAKTGENLFSKMY